VLWKSLVPLPLLEVPPSSSRPDACNRLVRFACPTSHDAVSACGGATTEGTPDEPDELLLEPLGPPPLPQAATSSMAPPTPAKILHERPDTRPSPLRCCSARKHSRSREVRDQGTGHCSTTRTVLSWVSAAPATCMRGDSAVRR
jgi:hypothetical protein